MSSTKVTVVDYGAGNLRSAAMALWRAGAEPEITADPDVVRRAERVVLPGVGAAGAAIEQLRARQLDVALGEFRASGRPLLGICVGMQLFAEELLEFGRFEGLAWMRGTVERISVPQGVSLQVPHMGWSEIELAETRTPMLGESRRDRFFYFCHSYKLAGDEGVAAASVRHGNRFTCAVAFDNVFGCQFHPEKSHVAGQNLLKRFLRWAP